MGKDIDVIEDYVLTLTYTCPVTKKEVILNNRPGKNVEFEFASSGRPWPGDVDASVCKCKSCGRYHDSFELG